MCFFSIICIKPGCVFYRYTACFFDEKKANYCKIQVSSLRRFAFATLRWPHCVRPPTPLRQPGSATRLITVLAPLPAHSGAQITWPLQSFIATFLDLRVNGFGRFCTLRHRYPPDGPPSLNVNLTLESQEYFIISESIFDVSWWCYDFKIYVRCVASSDEYYKTSMGSDEM